MSGDGSDGGMMAEEYLRAIEHKSDAGWGASPSEAWALVAEIRQLQGAINRYCETRNNVVVGDCGPHDDAIRELYRLSRESGFRPRVRASSEVER